MLSGPFSHYGLTTCNPSTCAVQQEGVAGLRKPADRWFPGKPDQQHRPLPARLRRSAHYKLSEGYEWDIPFWPSTSQQCSRLPLALHRLLYKLAHDSARGTRE